MYWWVHNTVLPRLVAAYYGNPVGLITIWSKTWEGVRIPKIVGRSRPRRELNNLELRSDTSHALQLPSDPQSACSSLLVSRKNQVDLIDQDLTENGRIITLKVIWVCKSYPSEFWRDHTILSSKNEVIKFSLGRGEWWADVIDSVHESRFSCCGW